MEINDNVKMKIAFGRRKDGVLNRGSASRIDVMIFLMIPLNDDITISK